MSFKIHVTSHFSFEVYDSNNRLVPQNQLVNPTPIINDIWIYLRNPSEAGEISPVGSIETTNWTVHEGWSPFLPDRPVVSTPPDVPIDESWDQPTEMLEDDRNVSTLPSVPIDASWDLPSEMLEDWELPFITDQANVMDEDEEEEEKEIEEEEKEEKC